ncbi:hypothetical protein NHQ30_007402 [Ciborinia camelliae]|nr:hypothetical protein NHQ30_007402 [Ciborinia camelliae]
MFSKIFTFTTLVAAVSAFQVLTPTLNSTVAKGKSTSVKWSSVDTDAPDFSIYLVNFKDWPPTVISLAQNVPSSEGSVDVNIPCNVNSDYGWQLNFINGTNTYVIYAQSHSFSLTGSCVDPTTTSSIPISTTTAYATAYKNATVTAYSTVTKTAIAKVIETVTFDDPVVWFVQPSNAGGMCKPEKTVTVYASGPSPTGASCDSQSSGSSGSSGSSSGSGPAPSGTYSNTTVPAHAVSMSSPSGTGASKPQGTSTTPLTISTNAGTSVQAGSMLALIACAAVFLL